MKDVRATREGPQNRTSRTPNHEIFSLFKFFGVILALLDLDPDPADQNQCGSMPIRIQSTAELPANRKGMSLSSWSK